MTAIRPVNSLEVPRFAGISTFMRLPWITDLSQLDVAFIGVPFDGGQSSRTGARFGPRAVRDMSSGIKPYNAAMQTDPYKKFRAGDYGDFVTNPLSVEESLRKITEQMDAVLRANVFPICVGGDHSISLPLLRAIAKKHGPVGLITFDAHHDTQDEYFGSKYGSGTPFRRAIEEKCVDPRRTVMIGLRGTIYREEDYGFCRDQGIRTVMMEELYERGTAVALDAMEQLRTQKCYVTFDIDGVDPAFAPGVTGPVPGGFTSAEAIQMIRRLKGFNIVGFDVVEVMPMYDTAGITALLAATLAFEFLCTR
ncbi:MAG: agmatinase [Chloroflexi bacterium]|nr:agmatinase [Chloroflexota bacterium]